MSKLEKALMETFTSARLQNSLPEKIEGKFDSSPRVEV